MGDVKIMKKISTLVLALLLMALCFTGCGKTEKDSEYVKNKGTLVVGITDFEPMDYKDANGNWIGFDADMATAFAESLGVKVKFVEIDWDNKILELDGKSIDCVWNGMTLVDEVTSSMNCTKPYCNNAQIIVVKKDVADKYKTAESCKNLKFAVEKGSAGKDMADQNKFQYTEVDTQSTALTEVKSGQSDAAIIDSLMAGAMIGEGKGYSDLTYTASLNSEKYGVGFRLKSDLTEMLNKFFDEYKQSGKLNEIAEKYGVQEALIK